VVVPKPYWFYVTADGTPQPGSATTHGSMYAYDQHVPLILFGAGIKRGEYLRAATPADIAPTLAQLCGITLARIDGEVLIEALSPAAVPPLPPARSAGAPKR
jgi:phosphoglycerol transferase MdoB-like AlkP superfamily enzyme